MDTEYKIDQQEYNATYVARAEHAASQDRYLYQKFKRIIDISVSLSALIFLGPIMLISALMIFFDSKGPILFKQTRVGERGQIFAMWKFRSMHTNSEELKKELVDSADMSDGVRFKMENDPRITKVGHIIRKLSIDELPQLLNVLKGDMSLVGPRPALPDEVNAYTTWQRLRLNAKPGITCIWQVSGRSNIPFLGQVAMDIDYIQRASLKLDILILLKTIPAVLLARGAH